MFLMGILCLLTQAWTFALFAGGRTDFSHLIIKSFLSGVHNIHVTISKSFMNKASEFDTPRQETFKLWAAAKKIIRVWHPLKKAHIWKSLLWTPRRPPPHQSFSLVAAWFPLIVIHSVFLPAPLSWLIVLFPHCRVLISSSHCLITNAYA